MQDIAVTTTVSFSKKDIAYLLSSAFEGGSNYWYMIVDYVRPTVDVNPADFEDKEVYRYLHYPLTEGGAVLIADKEDEDEKTFRLDLDAIKKGMQIFSDKYPNSFNRFRTEDYDANDGDTYLQCCLFGEAIYG